jgi:hypothetical protein
MSWRVLIVFVVLVMAGSAMGGVALGNWLVDQAPGVSADPRTNTNRPPEMVLDAAGRPLAGVAPQPLIDGGLGVPPLALTPDWQVQGVSLFDTVLDPMVVLARGDEAFTVSDMLSAAGQGLAQGPSDIATVDVTVQQPEPVAPQRVAAEPAVASPTDMDWRQQLAQAIKACDSVGFFSRPNCVERARKKFCEPNKAWGQDELCPAPNSW